MVPDIAVKPAAAMPVAAEKGTVPSGGDGAPIFGDALRAACKESDAPAQPPSGNPRDPRRSRDDVSSAPWLANLCPVAGGSATAPGEAEVVGLGESMPDLASDEADSARSEDEGSSPQDAALLLATQGQSITAVPPVQPAQDAGIEPADAGAPPIDASCESADDAEAVIIATADRLAPAGSSSVVSPAAAKADSPAPSDSPATDRATEVRIADAGSDVSRSTEASIDVDVRSTRADETIEPPAAPRKGTLDLQPTSTAHQIRNDKSGVAAAPGNPDTTETPASAVSSPISRAPEPVVQSTRPAVVEDGAESFQSVTPDRSPAAGDSSRALPIQPPGSSDDERQAEHGSSPRDQRDHASKPMAVGQALAARAAALFAPGLALTQTADGTLTLMPVMAASALAQSSAAQAENLERLVQTMHVMVKGNVSEATVRLRPEHLGEVSVAIRVEGKAVTATVTAEAASVREWLQSHEEALRTGLQQQGLTLDRLIVQREARQERREQQHQEARRSRPRRGQDPQPRFEVSA
jgi:flagellar hook-length control protein FliK